MSIPVLPRDVALNIMSWLSLPDCAAASKAFKALDQMIQPNLDERLWREVLFGRAEWLKIPGVYDVGEQPPIPPEKKAEIIAKLKLRCDCFNEADPVQPHRFESDPQFIKGNIRRWKTRKIFLFPETINGIPRTVDVTGRIFHFLKTVNPNGTAYEAICGDENSEFRKEVAQKSSIYIVTTDVFPGTRGKDIQDKEDLVKRKSYRLATPNDAAVVIHVLNIGPSKEGKGYFFGREGPNWWTYTITSGTCEGRPVYMGVAAPPGSRVGNAFVDDGGCDDFERVGALAVEDVL